VRDDNDEHSRKQPSPRELTEFGIVRDDNDEHRQKQPSPRELTEFGIVRDDNDEHPQKQSSPRELTEFGIVSEDNDEQSLKHLFPMETMDFGSFNFLRLQQFPKQSSGKEQIVSGNSNVSIEQFKILSSPFVILIFSDIEQSDLDYYLT
jgi:hypothetical protein